MSASESITDTLPSLINGVSQQPATLRLPSQVSEQINKFPSEVDGLRDRPPFKFLKTLTGLPVQDFFIHTIRRDAAERYFVFVEDGMVRVYDVDGIEKPVQFPHSGDYLITGAVAAPQAFRAITIADHTFIVNTTKTVAKSVLLTPTRGYEALVSVRSGAYGRNYGVTVASLDGSTIYGSASYTTPDGGTASHSNDIDVENITLQLANQLAGSPNLPSYGFTLKRLTGGIIYIHHPTTDFTINAKDGQGGNAMAAFKKRTQRFTALPNFGEDGFEIEVVGEESTDFDSYYVRFKKLNAADSTGVWEETAASQMQYRLDPATMPHLLVRNADGTFTFKQAEWADRDAGDDATNPFPSFVGRQIKDVFLHRNRLGFVSGENYVLSEAGEYFNFFRTTATTTLDADRVDASVSTSEATLLSVGVPFGDKLLLFADQVQLALVSGEPFTPANLRAEPVSHYAMNLDVAPVLAGAHLYFASEREGATALWAYAPSTETEGFTAEEVTSHCPRYVPKNLRRLSVSPAHNIVLALSAATPNEMHVYKFYVNNGQRVQSAWGRWTLPAGVTILAAEFFDDRLLVLARYGAVTHLLELTLDHAAADPEARYSTRLDFRHDETGLTKMFVPAGSGFPDRTRIVLPYDFLPTARAIARTDVANNGDPATLTPDVVNTGTNWIEVVGDWTAVKFYVGTLLESRVRLSTPHVRRPGVTGGLISVTGGRLQLRHMRINYGNAGYFRVEVTPKARKTYRYDFSPYSRAVGGEPTIGDVVIVESGSFRWPVLARNTEVVIELVNDSPLPATFQDLTWEGTFIPPAQGPN